MYSSPAEQIISAFRSGKSDFEAIGIGISALVELTNFKRANVFLISGNGSLSCFCRKSESLTNSDLDISDIPPEAGVGIILSCPGPGEILLLDGISDAQDEWKSYFKSIGAEFVSHAIAYLISRSGSVYGFLSLEISSLDDFKEDECRLITHTSDAIAFLVEFMKLNDRYRAKIDECAAAQNELAALKK